MLSPNKSWVRIWLEWWTSRACETAPPSVWNEIVAKFVPFAIERDEFNAIVKRISSFMFDFFPGAEDVVRGLGVKRTPLGMWTGAGRRRVDRAFWRHPEMLCLFRAIVTLEDVKEAKPDVAGLLKVAQQLGVTPKNTLVIDDSDACVESAFRAGFPGDEVPASSDRDVDRSAHRQCDLEAER
jgi:beta-phosphoglucomutase-like phosphatase (HAD superfamily)